MNTMKTDLTTPTLKRLLSFIVLILFIGNTAIAQAVTTTTGNNIIYYLLLTGLCLLCAAVYVIRRASLALDEQGQSIFDFDSDMFKNMAENSKEVTVFVIVIVLLGLYLMFSAG